MYTDHFMLLMEILAIYSQNHIKTTQKRCQHSVVFLNAKVDSVYTRMHV